MKQFATVILTARARSASSSTTEADLPPSSSATRFTVSAPTAATRRPARVEPVNDTMSTSGCAASASPTTGPVPCTRLNTPAGRPAAWMISASRPAVSGAISLGLSTTVLPATSAGATLATICCNGKFHGVIAATTPSGSRTIVELPTVTGSSAPASISASTPSVMPMGLGTWTFVANTIGVPTSAVIVAASSSARALRPSLIRRTAATRSASGVADQPGNAAAAARTAASASASVPAGTDAMTSSVAGFRTSMRSPEPSTNSPPMR